MSIRTVTAILAALGISGCATSPLQNARFWKMDQCARMLTPQVRLERSDKSTITVVPRASCEAVVTVAGKIQQVANYYAHQIWLAEPEELNAFATVDNSRRPVIIVTVGMLKELKGDEDAWAGLLGHEIAHHVKNHGHGRAEAKAGAQGAGQTVGNIVAQLVPGVGGFIAANASNYLLTNAIYGAYSRPQEREADELGLEWMVAAGYKPQGMERLFDVLGRHSSGLPGFLSTHPGAEDRAKMVRDHVARTVQSRSSQPQILTSEQSAPITKRQETAEEMDIRLDVSETHSDKRGATRPPELASASVASTARASSAQDPNAITQLVQIAEDAFGKHFLEKDSVRIESGLVVFQMRTQFADRSSQIDVIAGNCETRDTWIREYKRLSAAHTQIAGGRLPPGAPTVSDIASPQGRGLSLACRSARE